MTVYYDPRAPGRSVLQPGARAGTWVWTFLFAAMTVAAGIWTASTWQGIELGRLVEGLRELLG